METMMQSTYDRVRNSTPDSINQKIDQKTQQNIQYYSRQNEMVIKSRIKELDHEWDIERVLALNASLFALTGVILGATVNKKWLILPTVITIFLAQHAIQGWCPPLPIFRKTGIRSRKEIDHERYSLLDTLENRRALDEEYL